MELSDYLKSGEKVYCQTETQEDYGGTNGDLAVTNNRVVYLKSSLLTEAHVVDVDVTRIEEVEYRSTPVNFLYLGISLAILFFSVFLFFAGQEIFQVFESQPIRILLSGLLVLVSILFAYFALVQKDLLTLKTPSDSHTFVGGDLEQVVHAIRGNSN